MTSPLSKTGSQAGTDRTYPMKRPAGHKPPVPRWRLQLPSTVKEVYTLYIGAQHHSGDTKTVTLIGEHIDEVLSNSGVPVDKFRVTHGFDLLRSKVWVAYYIEKEKYDSDLETLNLQRLWNDLGPAKSQIGLWIERFAVPRERLETNYARLDHKPGLAQLPGIEQPAHELSAYWGAGRDRIPASAYDLFPTPEIVPAPSTVPKGFGQRLIGSSYENMCHIRSGQWWEKCNEEERSAYEEDLQETLMGGMQYLWDHPEETGTIGLRFLQNLNDRGEPVRETCGAGFFRNWGDLEQWSSRHPSHLKIFNGAIRHAKRFGEDRKFMTWHEVWIFKPGEAHFEYVNCDPKTGVIKWVELTAENLP